MIHNNVIIIINIAYLFIAYYFSLVEQQFGL